MLQTVIGGRSLPLDRSSPDSLERAEVGSGMRGRVTRNGHGSYTDRNPLACRPWRQKEHEGETASLCDFATCHIPQSLPNPHDSTLPAICRTSWRRCACDLCARWLVVRALFASTHHRPRRRLSVCMFFGGDWMHAHVTVVMCVRHPPAFRPY